jgi:hypothetical protein
LLSRRQKMTNPSARPIECEVTFQSGDLHLAGTLLLPGTGGPHPAVLLLPGSGQVDRNENAKKLAVNALREIALHLAGLGIATFRYDKRCVGTSQGDYWETGFFDRVTDAVAALAWLTTQGTSVPSGPFCWATARGWGSAPGWGGRAPTWPASFC